MSLPGFRKIVNIIFIAVVTLTSDSELVLNKRRASKWYVITGFQAPLYKTLGLKLGLFSQKFRAFVNEK